MRDEHVPFTGQALKPVCGCGHVSDLHGKSQRLRKDGTLMKRKCSRLGCDCPTYAPVAAVSK